MTDMTRPIPRSATPTRSLVGRIRPSQRPYAQVIEEARTIAGTTTVTGYVYGDALLAQRAGGVSRYYQYDGFGSVRALTDAAGSVVDRYTYDAYGKLLDSHGSTINPYRYRGEQYEPALDAYYLRARYYQPETGRFLTTDPGEGFPNEPLSLHRYIYGNSDPLSHVDPSGRMSMPDMFATFVIINMLSTMAADQFQTIGNVYATLGEKVFPDASILGVNGTVPLNIIRILNDFFGLSIPAVEGAFNVFGIYGYELLFSVSSGQIALYEVKGIGLEGGHMQYQGSPFYRPPILNFGWSLYEGSVFNLWNAADYDGKFIALGVNWGKLGLSLFSSPDRVLLGPWGLSKTIIGGNKKRRANQSVLGSRTFYDRKETLNFDSEAGVAVNIMLIACVMEVIEQTYRTVNGQSLIKGDLFFQVLADITAWWQITLSKYHWNKKSGYSIQTRQENKREKFPYFQGGPGLFVLGRYL